MNIFRKVSGIVKIWNFVNVVPDFLVGSQVNNLGWKSWEIDERIKFLNQISLPEIIRWIQYNSKKFRLGIHMFDLDVFGTSILLS